jgi:hypothetical protein
LRVFGRGLTTTPVFGPSVPLRLSFSLIFSILKHKSGFAYGPLRGKAAAPTSPSWDEHIE